MSDNTHQLEMPKKDIDHIILTENAYFYKKDDGSRFFSASHINEIFVAASEDKKGQYLLNVRRESTVVGNEPIQFSLCVFKVESLPNFIDEEISPKWREHKLAYLLIVDFKDYVFISRKNVSGIDEVLYEGLNVIDYTTLNTLFVDAATSFEKFSLDNTNISKDAIKGKTVVANDLKQSFSPYGAGMYVLNSLRMNNSDVKTAIAFNTSKITKFGEKKYLTDLFTWAQEVIEKIRNHIQGHCFLDVFATPVDYEAVRDSLFPISLLFNLRNFHEDVEAGKLVSCELRLADGSARQISLDKIASALKNVFDVTAVQNGAAIQYQLKSKIIDDVVLSINKKSITIRSAKASKLVLLFDGGDEQLLVHYFNIPNDFIINFEDLSLVYTNRKLFKDSKLIGYVDSFIEVFDGKAELEAVTSEKGTFIANCTAFTPDCIFHFIEAAIAHDADYCFLDDLGNEWADYISLKSNTLTFIHGKYGTSQFSASSFHDVVGQAMKNVGNMAASNEQLDGKSVHWDSMFNIDQTATAIARLRRGASMVDGIGAYKKYMLNPNLKREIVLAINFISRAGLHDRLNKLKNGIRFAEKNQIIQILWLLSGLISSCQENGIGVHIVCKP